MEARRQVQTRGFKGHDIDQLCIMGLEVYPELIDCIFDTKSHLLYFG